MPLRLADDHEHVKHLLDESERVAALGNKWVHAPVPNPIAAEMCFRISWAMAVAGAQLRCWLKGELTTRPHRFSEPNAVDEERRNG